MKNKTMENNNITNKTTFWELLNNYEIVVPIIQRDYAQGRAGKEDLRKNFLGQIHNALEKKSELLLDFVYGTINNNKIYPLDGQQRLTTLWLLHWYYFYKNGSLEKNKEILKRFSYETRDSSKEFIRRLCEIKLVNNNSEKHIDELIQEQTWFLTKWKHDPTIQAMLRMLSGTYKKVNNNIESQGDGIEQLFKNEESLKLLKRLVNNKYCPIKFLFIDLEGIKQSDDLYIKMNARGKQLTSFENFKADLIDAINNDDKNKTNNDWTTQWDTKWTDIFWKEWNERDERDEIDEIDNLYFSFIKRYLYNEITLSNSEGNKEILKNLSSENQEYTSFKDYKILEQSDTFNGLCQIFDNITKFKEKSIEIEKILGHIKLLEKYKFIPQYEDEDKNNINDKKVSSITFQDRVLFYGICEYLKQKNIDANNEENLRQWFRILANLTYYNEITNEKEFASRLKSIQNVWKKILEEPSNIYVSLRKINIEDDIIKKDPIKDQLKEEQRKIMLISQNNDVEDEIIALEGFSIFQSHIDCLLDLIVCDSSKKEKICHRKLSKLLKILNVEEFNNVYNNKPNGLLRLLFRAILTEYKKTSPDKLLINNEHVRFRKLLNKSGEFYDPFQYIMKEFLNLKDPNIKFKSYLENIISNYKDKDWKVCLIKSDYLWTDNFSRTMKIHTREEKKGKIVYLYKGTYANKDDTKLCGNQCGISCPLKKSNTQP